MPVHGGDAWLDAALESIRPSADTPVEVVIRDSTPKGPCAEIIERHAKRLAIDYAYVPSITSWTRKTNMAIAASSAGYVAMLHQDDLWLPDRLVIAVEMIARHPEASLHLTSARIIDGEGRDLGPWRAPFATGIVDPVRFRDALLVQNSIAIPAPVFRRDAYLAVGGLDESLWYTPDWDLWLKLGAHGPVAFDSRPTSAFRVHGSSLTMTGNRHEFAKQLDIVLARHLPGDSRESALCHASARINVLLASAAEGRTASLFAAIMTLLCLGPAGIARYVRDSRIVERIVPRLRARLSGVF